MLYARFGRVSGLDRQHYLSKQYVRRCNVLLRCYCTARVLSTLVLAAKAGSSKSITVLPINFSPLMASQREEAAAHGFAQLCKVLGAWQMLACD